MTTASTGTGAEPRAREHPRSGSEARVPESSPPPLARERMIDVRRFANLHGKGIRGAMGEKLGEIADVVVDITAGQVPYVLVASRPTPGEGYRLRLVPTGALEESPRGGGYTVPFQAAQWRELDSIDARQLEAGALRAFEAHRHQLARVFGLATAWAEPSRLLLASHLNGKDVRHGRETLGTLKAILAGADRRTGFALVRAADMSQPRTVVLALGELQLPAFEADFFTTTLTREDLEDAPTVDINFSAALSVSTEVRQILDASMLSQSSVSGQKGYASSGSERGAGQRSGVPVVPPNAPSPAGDHQLSPTGKSSAETKADAIEPALAAVRKRIAMEPSLRDAGIEVEVRDGHLVLRGRVRTAAIRSRLQEIARQVAPAAPIENLVVVATP